MSLYLFARKFFSDPESITCIFKLENSRSGVPVIWCVEDKHELTIKGLEEHRMTAVINEEWLRLMCSGSGKFA